MFSTQQRARLLNLVASWKLRAKANAFKGDDAALMRENAEAVTSAIQEIDAIETTRRGVEEIIREIELLSKTGGPRPTRARMQDLLNRARILYGAPNQ